MSPSTCWGCRALSSAFCIAAVAFTPCAGAQAAPPRNTSDLAAQLRSQHGAPRQRIRDADTAREVLAASEPENGNRVEQFRHVMRRANAYGVLADHAAQKRELLRALQIAGDAPRGRYRALGALSLFEHRFGSTLAARGYTNQQLETARALYASHRLVPLSWQVYLANRLGDRAGAERAMAELDATMNRVRRAPGWPEHGEYWTSLQERARGRLHELHGNYAAAEVSAQTALAAAERYRTQLAQRAAADEEDAQSSPATGWVEQLTLELALYQARQNKLLAAELTGRSALQSTLQRNGFASPRTARALTSLARAVIDQGRYAEGEHLARESLRAGEAAGLSGATETVVHAREALGSALAMQARWDEAARVFGERAQDVANADPALRKEMRLGNFNWALALIRTGQQERARSLLQSMRRRFESYGGDTFGSLRVAYTRAFLGLSYVEQGWHEQALVEFRASVPQLLDGAYREQREDREGPAAIARLNYILEGYMRALAERDRARPEPGAAAEIFQLADVARASRVQRALSLGASRAAARDARLLKLVEEEQALRDRVTMLSGVQGELLAAADDQQLKGVIGQMRTDLAQIEGQRGEIRARIAREFPEYAGLVFPRPVTLEQARRALRSGEALLSIYLAEDRAYAWGISPGREVAFALIPLGRSEVADTVARLRASLDPGPVSLSRFPEFDLAAAHALYAAFVQPVETALADARTLVVAPHAALAQIPFGLLLTAPTAPASDSLLFAQYRAAPWLARRVALVQVPAVSSLVTLASLPAPPADRKPFIGYGDPIFSKDQMRGGATLNTSGLRNLGISRNEASAGIRRLPPLPDTRQEVREIARVLRADPDKDVLVGIAASRHNVDDAHLAGRRVVAFATHGLVPGDLDGLAQPALALSSAEVTGVSGDGLLTMDDILGLRLQADWVVLSACNTASAGGAGEEAVSGLGRAFFFAGTRALLVSNWPVETVSARLLTTELFRRQAADPHLSRAEALRRAMLYVLDSEGGRDASGKLLFSYAHPMFWAPFTLVGDGN